MILKLINNENTYEFNVTDLNEGVKLYYHFEIPIMDIPDGKYNMQLLDGETVIYGEHNVNVNVIVKFVSGDKSPSTNLHWGLTPHREKRIEKMK